MGRGEGGGGRGEGCGREGGKEEVDDIYGDSTSPPPLYIQHQLLLSFPPPPHSTPPCSYCAYRQSTECSRKSPSV